MSGEDEGVEESVDGEDADCAVFGVGVGGMGGFELGPPKKFDIQDICRRVLYRFLAANCADTSFLSSNGLAFEVYSVRRHLEHSVLDVIFAVDVFAKSRRRSSLFGRP